MSDQLVVNRFREALGDQLRFEAFRTEVVERIFDPVRRALEAGAWDSVEASRFAGELAEQQRLAARSAQECYEVLERRHRREPLEVESSDERARSGH